MQVYYFLAYFVIPRNDLFYRHVNMMTRKLAKKKNMNTELLPSMMLDLQNLVWHLNLFRLNQRKVCVFYVKNESRIVLINM